MIGTTKTCPLKDLTGCWATHTPETSEEKSQELRKAEVRRQYGERPMTREGLRRIFLRAQGSFDLDWLFVSGVMGWGYPGWILIRVRKASIPVVEFRLSLKAQQVLGEGRVSVFRV